MRISDWSSDVCSSDLCGPGPHRGPLDEPGIEMLTSGTTGAPKRFAMNFDLIFRSMVGESIVLDKPEAGKPVTPGLMVSPFGNKIGRASSRERVFQYV